MITSNGLEKLGFTPNVDFVIQDDGDGVFIKEWNSASPQPSESEIETAHAEWQAEYDSQAYTRARKYPSWQEQMDMMFHDQTEGSRTWLNAIEAVKEAYPK